MNNTVSPPNSLSFNEEHDDAFNVATLTISPTKSLIYNDSATNDNTSYINESHGQNKIELDHFHDKTSTQYQDYMSNSVSNSTIDSFVTATSNMSLQDSSFEKNSETYAFASLNGNNNSSTTLQQTRYQKKFDHETTFETPKINTEHTPTFQKKSSDDNMDIRENSLTHSFINKDQIHVKYSSPKKAIRASRLVNSEHIIYGDNDINNSGNDKDQWTVQKELQIYNQDNDDSLHFENTINTITLDTLDLSNRPPQYTVTTSNKEPSKKNTEGTINYSYLFIIALHRFDAKSLKDKEDVQICLSFEKNDVAFVHVADESGWGQVSLLKQQKRGWVPLNYFTDVIQPDLLTQKRDDGIKQLSNYIASRIPLESLLTASGKFLVDFEKQSETNKILKIDLINGIRDGVKNLLQLTECVSRSDDLVRNSFDIKKTRKRLLADWYNLMIKADYYKNNHSPKNLSTIVLLVFAVIERAFAFYSAWGQTKLSKLKDYSFNIDNLNNKTFNEEKLEKSKNNIHNDIFLTNKYLKVAPHAIERLGEIYNILFTYIGIILGRIDIIQHNSAGCESLELIVHQIIILLRELLYISKSCSYIIQEKYKYAYESTLDSNLDPLLSLVSELVSCIKVLVTQMLNESQDNNPHNTPLALEQYSPHQYTPEGKHLIKIVSQMAPLIKNVVFGCNNYIRLIGNFQLANDREYLDFSTITITPENFIKKCGKLDLFNQMITSTKGKYSLLARFSRIQPIKQNETNNKMFLFNPLDDNEKEFSRNSVFDKFRVDEDFETKQEDTSILPANYTEIIQKEILLDSNGALIGASFRAFIFKLTDELDKPSDLLVASFLLNFRKYGNTVDLVDELIARFDIVDNSSRYDTARGNGIYSSRASRLKTRRRLVCSIFQKWMESYWDVRDYSILPTMVNFFNEVVSTYLPIESKNLIVIACKLFLTMTNTSMETNNLTVFPQLKTASMICPRVLSVISEASSINSIRSSVFSLDDRIIDQYGLGNTKSNSGQNNKSLLLPLLDVGESSLLSNEEVEKTNKSIMFYEHLTKIAIDRNIEYYKVEKCLGLWRELNTVQISTTFLMEQFNMPSFGLTDIHPLELAKQLTALESNLFLQIKPSELVNYKDSSLSPNITAILKFGNQLSNYVTETICAPYLSLGQRVSRLKSWLRIALSCAYFRNFDSVAIIMASLQNHSIERLYPLWDSLDKKESTLFDYLVRIVHPNHNYKVYRTKLNSITRENQYSKSPLPVVPFVNLYIQDLTFLDDGNPNFRDPYSFRPNKLINVDKYIRMTKIIGNLQFFQVGYSQSSLDSLDKRNSFFQVAESLSIDTDVITNIPILQELIVFELWRVSKYYELDLDRGYHQSLRIIPKN